jgi:hypothetical protein
MMSHQYRHLLGSLSLFLAVIFASRLPAQEGPLPLTPLPPSGDIVAPFFDGWYLEPDGTYTFSFGYFNRNTEQIIDIPVGPDNSITPAEYDGLQPTHFRPANYGGFSGRRERGTFTVNVPGDFRGDVVWTLRLNGQTLRVPGRSGIGAYELSHSPQAAGTQPPFVKVDPGAQPVFGRGNVATTTLTAKVGEPITLWVWGEDRGEREARFQVNATWVKHQGVGEVTFAPGTVRSPSPPGGEMSTQATFSAPGEYVIRVRVDNFTASDSSFADQCCWSNGYYRVTVTE